MTCRCRAWRRHGSTIMHSLCWRVPAVPVSSAVRVAGLDLEGLLGSYPSSLSAEFRIREAVAEQVVMGIMHPAGHASRLVTEQRRLLTAWIDCYQQISHLRGPDEPRAQLGWRLYLAGVPEHSCRIDRVGDPCCVLPPCRRAEPGPTTEQRIQSLRPPSAAFANSTLATLDKTVGGPPSGRGPGPRWRGRRILAWGECSRRSLANESSPARTQTDLGASPGVRKGGCERRNLASLTYSTLDGNDVPA